jgi:hypothetical protein
MKTLVPSIDKVTVVVNSGLVEDTNMNRVITILTNDSDGKMYIA